MKQTWTFWALVSGAITMLLPATAGAQSIDGKWQFGLATPLFSYSNQTITAEVGGVESKTDASTTSWGIGDEVLLEIGYAVSDMVVLGVLLQSNSTSASSETDNEAAKGEESSAFIAPKLDFILSPGAKIRPFIGAAAGLVVASAEAEDVTTSLVGFQAQARLGLHSFHFEGFSTSTALAFDWITASGETEGSALSADVSTSGFALSAVVNVSGWL